MRIVRTALGLGWLIAIAATAEAQDGKAILNRADMRRGVCFVLGAGDGSLPLSLARAGEMLVHVRDAEFLGGRGSNPKGNRFATCWHHACL